MAEARNAIDLYYLQKQGFHITGVEDGYFTLSVSIPYPSTLVQAIRFSVRDMMKTIRNRLWPASLSVVLTVMGAVSAITVRAPKSSWFRNGSLAHLLWSIDGFVNKWNSKHGTLPIEFRVWYLASLAAFIGMIGIMTFERLLLRVLLSYKSWLYVKPKTKIPFPVTVWGAFVKILSGSTDLTHSFALSLPSLPLPSLNHTITCYLDSVRPLLSKDEYKETEKLAREFQYGEGRKFQRYLWFKWFTTRNYVAEWWEKYVYLRGRTPLAVNSNYYITDSISRPTTDPVERAAHVAHHFLKFKDQIENQTLKPMLIRNMVPLCMDQYTKMFGTSRIPGREFDRLVQEDSRHIVVLYRGEYFKLNVYHGARGTNLVPYSSEELKQLLSEVVSHVDQMRDTNAKMVDETVLKQSSSASKMHSYSRIQSFSDLSLLREREEGKTNSSPLTKYEGSGIAALTAGPRSNWAEIREVYFSSGINRRSLREIESAAFLIILETESYSTLTERGRALFTGNGFNRFFDKSLSLVVFKDGYIGLNTEHSWADAPVVAHLWEYALLQELKDYQDKISMMDNVIKPGKENSVINFKDLRLLQHSTQEGGETEPTSNSKLIRLSFEINEQLERSIQQAGVYAQTLISDLDLEILAFDEYGANYMKSNGLSPDAFVQMALQLAYFKFHGQFDLTYESSMTRLFRYGRTETIRALSEHSTAWVLAMVEHSVIFPVHDSGLSAINEDTDAEEGNSVSETKEYLIELLKKAAQYHSIITKDSMVGKGIDRHLFALYITSRGFDVESKFLNGALSIPWRLSTSQQPQKQTLLRKALHPDIARYFMSPGGGFGPVADDGYGVSYMIVGGTNVFFHVSSKFSSERTSSKEFMRCIKQALSDMKVLFS